jgi:hypothetical protein
MQLLRTFGMDTFCAETIETLLNSTLKTHVGSCGRLGLQHRGFVPALMRENLLEWYQFLRTVPVFRRLSSQRPLRFDQMLGTLSSPHVELSSPVPHADSSHVDLCFWCTCAPDMRDHLWQVLQVQFLFASRGRWDAGGIAPAQPSEFIDERVAAAACVDVGVCVVSLHFDTARSPPSTPCCIRFACMPTR